MRDGSRSFDGINRMCGLCGRLMEPTWRRTCEGCQKRIREANERIRALAAEGPSEP